MTLSLTLARAIPLAYIAAPTLTALYFFFLTERTPLDSYAPVNLRFVFQFPILVAALALGFGSKSLEGHTPLWVKILLGILVVSILWGFTFNAVDPFVGVASLVFRGLNVMLALMLIFLIHRAGERLRTRLILAIPVAYALHFCVILAMLPGLLATEHLDWLNNPPGVFQVRLWGMILTAAFAIAVVYTAQPGALRKIWPPLVLMLLGTALCYTGTRGALPALVAGFGVTALVMTRVLGPMAVTLVLGLAIGAILSLALPVPHPAYGLISSYTETVTSQNVNELSAGRMALWSQTLEIWSKHPVFGIGYEQFRFLNYGRFESFPQPHNSVLEFILFFGVVGGLALLGILFWLWLRAAQAARAHPDPARVAAFFALNALLAMSLLDGTLYHQDTLQIYAVLWACLLARPTGVGGQSQPATL